MIVFTITFGKTQVLFRLHSQRKMMEVTILISVTFLLSDMLAFGSIALN